MATVTATATYPDALQVEVRDVLCFEFGYQDEIDGSPNPETKAQFLQRQFNTNFKNWLKNTYKQGKLRQQTITELDVT
jgi:hypothetical protein